MIEKARVFLSQLVASSLFVFLAVRMGINIINNTGLKSRLSNIGFNYKSFESVAVGLLLSFLAAICIMFVIWLIRWPKTNYMKKKKKKKRETAREIDMGTIKNIPKAI